MTEREAWQKLARWSMEAAHANGPMKYEGLCAGIEKQPLNYRQKKRMLAKVARAHPDLAGHAYHWLRNAEGYRARAKFCHEQASLLPRRKR